MTGQLTYFNRLDHPAVGGALFFPRADSGPLPDAAALVSHVVDVDGSHIVNCRFHLAENCRAVLLFFHGNGETAGDYDDIGPRFTALGLHFLVTDYRGYGQSTGSPQASALLHDAHVILASVLEWMQGQKITVPLLVMGRSLGSAPAVELAAFPGSPVKGLIVESGFAHTMPLLQAMGIDTDACGLDEDDGFGNAAKIAAVTCPTLILHGQRDQLIAIANAETLQAQCGAQLKQFFIVPGADHNNIMAMGGLLYFDTIGRFIDKITGGAKRKRR